jgi:threonyl-tRNA synthetase
MDNDQELKNMRHSGAHLLAAAVKKLYPDVKLGVGPAIDYGFYHDLDLGDVKLSEKDFPAIESEMNKLQKEKIAFEKVEMSFEEGKKFLKERNQPYTLSLLEDLQNLGSTVKGEQSKEKKKSESDTVTFYKNRDFINMCRGGHVHDFSEVGPCKIVSVAGAYFRGDEKNPMLTRIYVACFPTQKELDEYLTLQEEAKKRDHRKIGKEMNLFLFSDLVGSGLPLYTPKGALLRKMVNQYVESLQSKAGVSLVWTPQIAKAELFKISGHYDKYKDDMFRVTSNYSEEEFFLKPMNCPQHTQIYASKPRSYRDLPIRFGDFAMLYRDEKPGELSGLARVRSFSQDDCHIFCREDQVDEEVDNVLAMTKKIMATYGLTYRYRLSTRDPKTPEKYIGDPKTWDKVESWAVKIMERNHIDHFDGPGEAAFYAPKMDLIAKDSLGREWQLSTLQIDFFMPERFNLSYTDKDGSEKRPVMLHRAIIGSSERFLMVLIEHFNGHFPFWLAPTQIKIVTISDQVANYVGEIEKVLSGMKLMEPLEYNEIRYEIDDRNESLGRKIRDAQLERIPMIIVVGPKDAEGKKVSIRMGDKQEVVALSELEEYIHKQNKI